MASASNELHLTEANKEAIRELVRMITPDFEAQVWERVSLARAKEREREDDLTSAKVKAMQQMMNQTAGSYANAMAQQIYNASPLANALMQSGAVTRRAFIPVNNLTLTPTTTPVYRPDGAGFTPYGPLPVEVEQNVVAIDTMFDKWSNFPS